MIFVGVSSFLPPPIWNRENEHGLHVFHCASAAAIFMGWYFASITPSSLPTNIASTIDGQQHDERQRGGLVEGLARRALGADCQADTASITSEPVTSEARITCT